MKGSLAALALCLSLANALPSGPFADSSIRLSRRDTFGKLALNGTLPARTFDTSKLGLDPGVEQFSGYIDDNPNDRHMWYWFFKSRSNPAKDPLVLYLTGGPGCSSLLGVFSQGPSFIKNGQLSRNPFSWNNNASVIFIDQPAGVGFSHTKKTNDNSIDAAKDVYTFIKGFFQKFPDFANHQLHIAGESYGGQFILPVTREIMTRNDIKINLKSIMIGSGQMDKKTAFPQYHKMACGKAGFPAVLNATTCARMESSVSNCTTLIDACNKASDIKSCNSRNDACFTTAQPACKAAADFCFSELLTPYSSSGFSFYDIRKKCGTPGTICDPAELGVDAFINQNQKTYLPALGVEELPANYKYESCGGNTAFADFGRSLDPFKPYHDFIPDILAKMPVFVYGGDADYLVPLNGNQETLENMNWPGKAAFKNAQWEDFMVGGKKVGRTKSANGLKLTRITDAGHEVSWYNPEALGQMFNGWLTSVASQR
ncbi:hypothetical protein ABW21_db0204791 [Orbilia brochopaga]|nr:hypothetical protein ABW21_db0204791 [Drechslerella brochopaga]